MYNTLQEGEAEERISHHEAEEVLHPLEGEAISFLVAHMSLPVHPREPRLRLVMIRTSLSIQTLLPVPLFEAALCVADVEGNCGSRTS